MTTNDPRLDAPPAGDTVTTERVERYQPVVHDAVDDGRVLQETGPADTVRRIVWLVFGVLQSLIILRIVLLLLGANEGNDLVAFITGITDPFVEPFRGIFQLDEVSGASGTVLDVAAIVALIAWTLIEALVLGVLGLADRRTAAA